MKSKINNSQVKYPRIFIGGTGRSGTSILLKLLDHYEHIYSLPTESKFIIDYKGLINLADALTINYFIPQARETVYEF